MRKIILTLVGAALVAGSTAPVAFAKERHYVRNVQQFNSGGGGGYVSGTLAGLSSGAVYRYFPGKEDVILAIAEENMRDVVEMIHLAAPAQPGRSAGAAVVGYEALYCAEASELRWTKAVAPGATALSAPP